jgi:pantoate--beta-alanine ligase
MGCYHAGHEDLMRHGRGLAQRLVVSLFVNPAQFGPGEDLSSYPGNTERDAAIAEACGADVLFMPKADAMYAQDHGTWVDVPDMAKRLCGQRRPAHFCGVCTVVLKLFLLSRADVAVFGNKDWQQQAIIRRMVRDLNLPVRIETRPVVREADGLALSSRNVYLTPEERAQAPEIYRGLRCAQDLAARGEKDAGMLQKAVLRRWAGRLPLGRLDYLAVVHPETLEPVPCIGEPSLMACAVHLGKARLIDNILLYP